MFNQIITLVHLRWWVVTYLVFPLPPALTLTRIHTHIHVQLMLRTGWPFDSRVIESLLRQPLLSIACQAMGQLATENILCGRWRRHNWAAARQLDGTIAISARLMHMHATAAINCYNNNSNRMSAAEMKWKCFEHFFFLAIFPILVLFPSFFWVASCCFVFGIFLELYCIVVAFSN